MIHLIHFKPCIKRIDFIKYRLGALPYISLICMNPDQRNSKINQSQLTNDNSGSVNIKISFYLVLRLVNILYYMYT